MAMSGAARHQGWTEWQLFIQDRNFHPKKDGAALRIGGRFAKAAIGEAPLEFSRHLLNLTRE
jgi:hypothetical protein